MFENLKAEYRASLKSMDTEENIDLAFYRPLGFAWACLFRKLGITPNAVTIASIFIGVAAGICFYPTDIWINILGMVLLIWANSYDSADGQLARLTKQYSALGRVLDGMAGDFWFLSIYVAIALRTNLTVEWFGEHPWVIWVLAVTAGLFHAKQAAIADRYRQFHLFTVKGRGGSELDNSADLQKQVEALSWKNDFFRKLTQTIYLNYTRNQDASTPTMQRLLALLAERYPDGELPPELAAELRHASFPLCKWENFMTFNWRCITLFITLFIGYPWLYFVAELTVFNIVLLYTIHAHETFCRRFITRLEKGDA